MVDNHEVIKNTCYYNLIGKMLYISHDKTIRLNQQALYSMYLEYNRLTAIVDKMQNDPYAFLKIQCSWLDLEFDTSYIENRDIYYDSDELKKKNNRVLELL